MRSGVLPLLGLLPKTKSIDRSIEVIEAVFGFNIILYCNDKPSLKWLVSFGISRTKQRCKTGNSIAELAVAVARIMKSNSTPNMCQALSMFQAFPTLGSLRWTLMSSEVKREWLASAALYSGGCPTTTRGDPPALSDGLFCEFNPLKSSFQLSLNVLNIPTKSFRSLSFFQNKPS